MIQTLAHRIVLYFLINVWNIVQVFSVDEIVNNYNNRSYPCQGNQCKLPACCKWLYKRTGEVWYSCRDCQESEFNMGGWPMYEKTSIDVANDEAHMTCINRYCSAKNDYDESNPNRIPDRVTSTSTLTSNLNDTHHQALNFRLLCNHWPRQYRNI